MIKLNIDESSEDQPIKTIYFSNEQGECFRVAHFLGEKLVLDEMTQFTNSKEIESETLFNECYEVLAYRKFIKNSDGKYYGTEDYARVDGQLKKLNSIFVEIISNEDHHTKHKWFNGLDEYVYSTEVGDHQEFRYVKPNGETIDYSELHDFLSVNKPLDFYDVKNKYLSQIVKEYKTNK